MFVFMLPHGKLCNYINKSNTPYHKLGTQVDLVCDKMEVCIDDKCPVCLPLCDIRCIKYIFTLTQMTQIKKKEGTFHNCTIWILPFL